MGELGPTAEALHRAAGAQAGASGIDRLFTLGPLAQAATAEFGARAKHFENPEALIDELEKARHGDLSILVKGSRRMRMERIIEALDAGARPTGGGGLH